MIFRFFYFFIGYLLIFHTSELNFLSEKWSKEQILTSYCLFLLFSIVLEAIILSLHGNKIKYQTESHLS